MFAAFWKRPRLERLEDRSVPAVIAVTSLADAEANDGRVTLREAIRAANTDTSVDGSARGSGHDRIVFAPALAGRAVLLSGVGGRDYGRSALVVTSSLTIAGPARSGLTLSTDSEESLRLFLVAAGGSLALENLTLRGGSAVGGQGTGGGGGGAGMGGAVYNLGSLTLTNCLFVENTAAGGQGGGSNGGATGTDGRDGAWGSDGTPDQDGGAGDRGGNGGDGAAGGFGGGGAAGGAGGSGGAGGRGGPAQTRPTKGGDGGNSGHGGNGGNGGFGGGGGAGGSPGANPGMGGAPGFPAPNVPTGQAGLPGQGGLEGTSGLGGFGGGDGARLDGAPVGGGGAGLGGAIFNDGGAVRAVNTTFAANAAYGGLSGAGDPFDLENGGGYGAAVFNRGGAVSLTHCTIAGNTTASPGTEGDTEDGGGVVFNYQGTLGLRNSIVQDNVSASGVRNRGGTVTGSGNIVQETTAGTDSLPATLVASVGGAVLLPLANNGGPTATFALDAAGVGIDTAGPTNVTTDARGVPRPFGGAADVGAYEAAGTSGAIAPLNPVAEDSRTHLGDGAAVLAAWVRTLTEQPFGPGVAVVGTTGAGTWQYSTNLGRTWRPVGDVSDGAALLLRSIDRVRFLPDADGSGSAALTVYGWDQVTGVAGSRAAVDETAFSASTAVGLVTVVPVNDRPVLNPSAIAALNRMTPTAGPVTLPVSTLLGDAVTDVDGDGPAGVAVVGTGGTAGQWQYSRDGGATWTRFGTPTAATARLLDADDLIRFTPGTGGWGAVGLRFRAWDGTFGAAGATANVAVTAAFSTAEAVLRGLVNSAPVLTGPAAALGMSEDPRTHPGFTVNALLGTSARDPDAAALRGVAITGAGTGVAGRWQYSVTNGRRWLDLGAVSEGEARLLRATDRLRFIPEANANGVTSLTFRAWDRTAAVPDATANGGATAFSAAALTASLTVRPVNDRPTLHLPPRWVVSPAGDSVATLMGGAAHDRDGDAVGLAVTGVSGVGVWQYSLDGTTWRAFGPTSPAAARLLRPTDLVRFVPRPGFRGVARLFYRAWDQSGGVAGSVANSAGGAFSVAGGVALAIVS